MRNLFLGSRKTQLTILLVGMFVLTTVMHESASAEGFWQEPISKKLKDKAYSDFVRDWKKYSDQVVELVSQEDWATAQRKPAWKEMDKRFRDFVVDRLNKSPDISANELENHLNEAIYESGGLSLEGVRKAVGSVLRQTFVIRESERNSKFCVVGQVVWGKGHDNLTVLHSFARQDVGFVSMTQEVVEFDHSMLDGMLLKSQGKGEIRFLVFGTKIGNTRSALRSILYRFDGNRFEKLWERDRAPYGKIVVNNKDGFVYLDWFRYWRPYKYYREIYRQTHEGLIFERIEESDKPFAETQF